MTEKHKSLAFEIVNLKKPSALSQVIKSVPQPKGAVPRFGLPKWKVMPLESKIPMIPGPEGAYSFTRQKVGKKLWMGFPDAEFNLNDPYGYEAKFSYASLHDEHLAPYFSRPNIIQHMVDLGFITKDLDAKCSLKDYNMYRKYLKKLHNDGINKELKRRMDFHGEKRILLMAEARAQAEAERFKARERHKETLDKLQKQLKHEKERQIHKQHENIKKYEERLKFLALKKMEEIGKRHEKSKARSEGIQQKRALAAHIERQKIIKTLINWSKSEQNRKKDRNERLARERENKRIAIEERWQKKNELQKKQINREHFLLHWTQKQRTIFIENYNRKINKERARLTELLNDTKTFVRCYSNRFVPRKRRAICCRAQKQKTNENNGQPELQEIRKGSGKSLKGTTRKNKLVVEKCFPDLETDLDSSGNQEAKCSSLPINLPITGSAKDKNTCRCEEVKKKVNTQCRK